MNSIEDLWSKLEKLEEKESKLVTTEYNVVLVGEVGSGKSSIIQSFLKPTINKEPKPTVGLEYSFARKKLTGNSQSSYLSNIWELGGDINEPKLLEIPMNRKNISNLSIVICIDLSKPSSVLASLQKWVKVIRELIKKVLVANKLSSRQIHNQNPAFNLISAHSKDSTRCRPCELPLYFILTKYDIFKSFLTHEKRSILQSIRMFAHYHGASVITTSTLESSLRDNIRSIMNTICFQTEKTNPKSASGAFETSIDRPLQISAGKDDFESILQMSLSKSTSDVDTHMTKSRLLTTENELSQFITPQGITKDCWIKFSDHLKALFGSPEVQPSPSNEREDESTTEDPNPFPEPDVDDARAQRDQILARYIQEAERREVVKSKVAETDQELASSEPKAVGSQDRDNTKSPDRQPSRSLRK